MSPAMQSMVHAATLRALDEAGVTNEVLRGMCVEVALEDAEVNSRQVPVDMILFCPDCHTQHVDRPHHWSDKFDPPEDNMTPDERADFDRCVKDYEAAWTNPPHKSHKCHNCGTIWRPCDTPTNGVAAISTRGKHDGPGDKEKADIMGGLRGVAYDESVAMAKEALAQAGIPGDYKDMAPEAQNLLHRLVDLASKRGAQERERHLRLLGVAADEITMALIRLHTGSNYKFSSPDADDPTTRRLQEVIDGLLIAARNAETAKRQHEVNKKMVAEGHTNAVRIIQSAIDGLEVRVDGKSHDWRMGALTVCELLKKEVSQVNKS